MKTMKKLLAFVLAFSMVLSLAVLPAAAAEEKEPFNDVTEKNWYYNAVVYVYQNGLMKGNNTAGDEFQGSVNASRAMVVTVLWRLAGEPKSTGAANTFEDLKQGWYKDAIQWAYENGITTGRDDKTFAPADNVTRQEMAAFLYRFCDYMKYDAVPGVDISSFPDASNVSSYAVEYMKWAVGAGLITGKLQLDKVTVKLEPRSETSRAELATLLMRLCETFINEPDPEPTVPSESTEPTEPVEGSEENPYVAEVDASKVANTVVTVEIPAGETVYYSVYYAAKYDLTVESADASITYNGTQYKAVNGVVSLFLSGSRMATDIAVTNNGTKAASFTLTFTRPAGHQDNPIDLGSEVYFSEEVVQKAAYERGIYYTWTAPEDGVLTIYMNASAQEGVSVTLYVDGEEVANGESIDVAKDQTYMIYMEAVNAYGIPVDDTMTFSGSFALPAGTESNPIFLSELFVPTELELNGTPVYFSGRIFNMTLTIENAGDVVVTLNGAEYTADENGILTVYFPASTSMGRPEPVTFCVTGNGNYTMSFAAPLGTLDNPEVLDALGEFKVHIEAGNTQGYYLTWTASASGTLNVSVSFATVDAYDVALSSTGSSRYPVLSENENGVVSIDVNEGDVVTIVVSTLPDSPGKYPEADLVLNASLT